MLKTISISDLLNQSNDQLDFDVSRFEEMDEPQNVSFPHKHDFYEVLWITHGKSKHAIDYKDYEIEPDTLFFISPGQLHLFEEWKGIKGYCVMFSEDFFLQLFQDKKILFELCYLDNLYINPYLKLNEANSSILQPIVNLLIKEKSPDIIQALLFVLLKKIQKFFSETNIDRNTQHQIVVFKEFRNLVEQNFFKKLTLTEYANMLNVTAHYLNSNVKTICNKTASDIIKERIILEAKQLLQFSDDTISQITDKLSFKDSSYFSRYFKKHTKTSPLEFRRKNLR
ncbi:helix-turn-helix transcriptional regulator [Pedobacter sp. Du54]|uniref:helix-turn-helix transcriptional regulator n=1 Tax=Pedobacter anseongensis TaxID=3133439 RepID=UPI0030A82AA0